MWGAPTHKTNDTASAKTEWQQMRTRHRAGGSAQQRGDERDAAKHGRTRLTDGSGRDSKGMKGVRDFCRPGREIFSDFSVAPFLHVSNTISTEVWLFRAAQQCCVEQNLSPASLLGDFSFRTVRHSAALMRTRAFHQSDSAKERPAARLCAGAPLHTRPPRRSSLGQPIAISLRCINDRNRGVPPPHKHRTNDCEQSNEHAPKERKNVQIQRARSVLTALINTTQNKCPHGEIFN
jgi:hypothetical protein